MFHAGKVARFAPPVANMGSRQPTLEKYEVVPLESTESKFRDRFHPPILHSCDRCGNNRQKCHVVPLGSEPMGAADENPPARAQEASEDPDDSENSVGENSDGGENSVGQNSVGQNSDGEVDEVDEWGRESFPASDPPSAWSGPSDT